MTEINHTLRGNFYEIVRIKVSFFDFLIIKFLEMQDFEFTTAENSKLVLSDQKSFKRLRELRVKTVI